MDRLRRHQKQPPTPTEHGYSPERDEKGAIVYDDLQIPALNHTTEKKLIAKIDFRLMPVLCVMFWLAYLDKINIANAEVFGLSEDINIDSGTQFNNALVIFFVPYIVLEIPSNIAMKRFKPSLWIPGCMFMFGLIGLCQGFVTNYAGIMTARFFLGVAETPMFPGAFYLIGMWYKRTEAQRRYTFFYTSVVLAGAFGGLLAAAIGNMDGIKGYEGWRWIFILEGLLTCVVAIVLFFVFPDFPEDAKWISDEERAYVKARLAAEQGRSAADRPITSRDVLNVFKDWKVWVAGLMYFSVLIPGYGYAYFSPTIIAGLGFSPIRTQLFSVAPYAVTFVWCMLIAFLSDFTKHRFLFIIGSLLVAIGGTGALVATDSTQTWTQYGLLFLFVMGTYGSISVMVCWFTMNLGGHHRRAVGTAWQIACGQIGGIVAVYAFLKKDAPDYVPGYSISLAFAILGMLCATTYAYGCWSQNRAREKAMIGRGVQEQQAESSGSLGDNVDPEDRDRREKEKAEAGDMAPEYRYML